jgi:predicted transcriptional regulator
MTEPELRDKDHVILEKISEGLDDTQKITSETTLQNHEIRYSLKKLQDKGLIELEKPDDMVERVINGQKRVFQAPLQAEPTEKGLQTLNEQNQEGLEKYEDLTHGELVEKVRDLEDEVDKMRESFRLLKRQIQNNF